MFSSISSISFVFINIVGFRHLSFVINNIVGPSFISRLFYFFLLWPPFSVPLTWSFSFVPEPLFHPLSDFEHGVGSPLARACARRGNEAAVKAGRMSHE